jgi:WD40 repeat protein
LTFSADGRYLAGVRRTTGSANMLDGGGAHWWRLSDRPDQGDFSEIHSRPTARGPTAYGVCFGPAGRTVALNLDRVVVVRNLADESDRLSFPLTSSWAAGMTFLHPGNHLVAAAGSFLYLFGLDPADKPERIKTGLRVITGLAASPDGRTLFVVGAPPTIEIYDVPTRQRRAAFDFDVGRVHAVAAAPDGCTFAVAGDRGVVVGDLG